MIEILQDSNRRGSPDPVFQITEKRRLFG